MINRKVEMFLIIIGLAVFFFLGVSAVAYMNVSDNEEVATEQYEEMIESIEVEEDLTYSEFIEMTKRTGTILLVIAIVSGVFGLIAILLLKGNRKPKTAGVLLLLVGVFNGFMPIIISLIASVFYIVAGLMALFRKPRAI